MLSFFTGPLLQSLAKTRELAVLEWVRVAIGLGFLAAAGFFARGETVDRQISVIAFARFVPVAFIFMPVFVVILMKLCGISLREMTSAVTNSVIASLSLVLVVRVFRASHLFADEGAVRLLLLNIGIGGIVGVTVLLLIDKEIRGLVRTMFRRISGVPIASK
jgi:hypothetical protein